MNGTPSGQQPPVERVEAILRRHGVPESAIGACCTDLKPHLISSRRTSTVTQWAVWPAHYAKPVHCWGEEDARDSFSDPNHERIRLVRRQVTRHEDETTEWVVVDER